MNFGKLNVNDSSESIVIAGVAAGAVYAALLSWVTVCLIKDHRDKKIREYINLHYDKICEFINKARKDDPFFFTEKRDLHKINDIAKLMEKFKKLYDKVSQVPMPNDNEDTKEYIKKLQAMFREFDISDLARKHETSSLTYKEAGYLDANLVKKTFSIDKFAWDSYAKASGVIDDIAFHFQSKFDESFYSYVKDDPTLKYIFWYDHMTDSPPDMSGIEVFQNIKVILKNVKKEFEEMRKSSKNSE